MTTFVVRIFMHLTDLLCSLPVKVGILSKNLCRKFQRPLTHAREHTVNSQSLIHFRYEGFVEFISSHCSALQHYYMLQERMLVKLNEVSL